MPSEPEITKGSESWNPVGVKESVMQAKTNDQPAVDASATGETDTIVWRGESYPVPSMRELERWVYDSVCETPEGDRVEPDHPDSWLSILGLI